MSQCRLPMLQRATAGLQGPRRSFQLKSTLSMQKAIALRDDLQRTRTSLSDGFGLRPPANGKVTPGFSNEWSYGCIDNGIIANAWRTQARYARPRSSAAEDTE